MSNNDMARIIRKSRKRKRSRIVKTPILAIGLFIVAVLLIRQSRRRWRSVPPSCDTAKIWSHRGHWDIQKALNYESNNNCDDALWALYEAGIHHFDMDVVYDDGQAIVAHPTELRDNLGNFVPSPCSRITLKYLLQRLDEIHGPNGYFITIEPKAAWHLEDRSLLLAPPKLVMKSILDALEESNLISPSQCGIILEEWQLDMEQFEMSRIWNLCRQTALPFKKTSALKPPSPEHNYRLSMPAMELFQEQTAMFMNLSTQLGVQNVVWIVDDKAKLRSALESPNVHGIISNRPVAMREYMREICSDI